MSDHHYWGVGHGRISKAEIKRHEKAAEAHGAAFRVQTGNQGHCECGHGCRLDACPVKRYWFEGPNYGPPFDQQLERAVSEELDRLAAAR